MVSELMFDSVVINRFDMRVWVDNGLGFYDFHKALPQALATALQRNPSSDPIVNENPLGYPNKKNPDPLHGAPTLIDAENWMTYLDKTFEVLECTKNQKWNALKTIEGEGFMDRIVWRDFLDVFYEHYFVVANREAYRREYVSIRKRSGESINCYMERFIRVAGIVGSMAGTAEEQAEKFKWTLHYETMRLLIKTKFSKVSEVANATKNLELEHVDFYSSRYEGGKKRGQDDHQDLSKQGRFMSLQPRAHGDRFHSSQSGQWKKGQNLHHIMGSLQIQMNHDGGYQRGQRQNQSRHLANDVLLCLWVVENLPVNDY
ncbi:zinc finger, CCHC-type, Retrotransposon gag domain protein [Artemisia annua]|uniref:Zinc finger, CCHC-type, Retrotransposon gag domain protein n=1 Tax=Artemisia annua TaxID=35608 RepID=A0A2U1QFM8_ARTAN|nr:zinc finger, CCHC-type, Retrotransposon gag domain protein [Artemisia annua]